MRLSPAVSTIAAALGLLLAAGAADARAQTRGSTAGDSLPAVRAHLSVDSVTVGDRFSLTLVTRHRAGRTVALPELRSGDPDPDEASGRSSAASRTAASARRTSPADNLPRIGDLRVVDAGAHHVRRAPDGTRVDSVELTVTTFVLDTARVSPIRVEVRGETDTVEASTGSLMLTVGSLVPADAQEPKGLMPIATFSRPLWPWAAGTLGALALVAAVLYLLRNRADEKDVEPTPEPRADPFEEALDRLGTLEVASPQNPAAVKTFFVALSGCLRTLVHRMTPIPARELTTGELVAALREGGPGIDPLFDEDDVRRLDVILRLSDLAKFADARPPEADGRSALRAARKVVLALKNARAKQEAAPAPSTPETA